MADGTPAEIAFVRRRIGLTTPPTDADVMQQIITAGSQELAAQWYLQAKLATLLDTIPFSVPGYTQGSVSSQITAIEKQLAELETVTGVEGEQEQVVTTANLIRSDRCRR